VHFHNTPQQVVRLIKKHVPRRADKVLDPAVGEGALLGALKANHFNKNLTLVDIDPKRLNSIHALYENLSLISADFTIWSKTQPECSFDLIVTNPPFSARSEKWVDVEGVRLPIELIFFRDCIRLLQKNGTMIAIVPDILVNSTKFKLEREWYFTQGAFTHAYQLPARSFENIEASFFLVVFKKSRNQNRLELIDVEKNTKLIIDKATIQSNGNRLDYKYYFGKNKLDSVLPNNYISLSSICTIRRGPIRENYKSPELYHSDSFRDGYWLAYKKSPCKDLCIGVKRVSRSANLSFGLYPTDKIRISTDCIVFITPPQHLVYEIFFYLRVVFSNSDGEALLLKGSGAKFIQVKALMNLPYFNLKKMHPNELENHKLNYETDNFEICIAIESKIYSSLQWGKKVSLINNHRSVATMYSSNKTTVQAL